MPPCSARCWRRRSKTTLPSSCSTRPTYQVQGVWSVPCVVCQINCVYFNVYLSFAAVTSGAFCCDVALDPRLDSWTPSEVCGCSVFYGLLVIIIYWLYDTAVRYIRDTISIFFVMCVCLHPGVIAVSDPRGPAADPPRPALGASGGGALCGPGGLLREQVDGLQLLPTSPPRSSLSSHSDVVKGRSRSSYGHEKFRQKLWKLKVQNIGPWKVYENDICKVKNKKSRGNIVWLIFRMRRIL